MSHVELVLWLGLATGLAFGVCGQATGFCLHRGLQDLWNGKPGGKLGAFALALGVALLGSQALDAAGIVDLQESLYRMPTYSWLLMPLGGMLFGYGMVLANGCGARALVLAGQGNLRSVVVLLCLGIAAYATLTGVLAPWRQMVFDATAISPGRLTFPEGVRLPAAVAIASLLFLVAIRSLKVAQSPRDLFGGLAVGLLVSAGWFITGFLGADDFEPVPVASLTFVAPIGDTIQYAMIATGMELRFGIAVVGGVVLGSLTSALVRRQYCLQGFETPPQLLRYMMGGAFMGIGGALAFGCSIGQGLTGLSTLSYSSMLAAAGIVAGARIAWRRAPGTSTPAVT